MHEAHRHMLVDVLKHVATGGESNVSEAHFDRTRNTIVFQRNRALSKVEIAQVVLERLGFPAPVVSAYITTSNESAREAAQQDGQDVPEGPDAAAALWLPECKTVNDLSMNEVFLDSVAHDLFLTLVNAERGVEATAQDDEEMDEATAEMNAEMTRDEWETTKLTFADIFSEDADDIAAAAAAADGDEEDGDYDEDDYDDHDLRLQTSDGADVKVVLRVYGNYPAQPPSLLIPATMPLSPDVRNGVLTNIALCIAAHAGGHCMMPVVSALQGAVADVLSVQAEQAQREEREEKARQLAAAKAKEQKGDTQAAVGSRQQFLETLVAEDKSQRDGKRKELEVKNTALGDGKRATRVPGQTAGGASSAKAAPTVVPKPVPASPAAQTGGVLPEAVKPKSVDVATISREFVRTSFTKRLPDVDKRMFDEWAKLQKQGSLTPRRRELPAFLLRDELKRALAEHQVVVVGGDTGSGKTTQIPQYVLEFFAEEKRGSLCNIVCTQPRRLAATAVALRVADERDEPIGGTVGYSIRLENRIGANTRLLYCTTGILLRRLQSDPLIGNISHVIVDEIHERGVDTDFLLILLRDLLRRRKDLKVILMSATMNAAKFSDYFGGTPVLSIPGRTHPVTVHSLEKIIPTIKYVMEEGSRYSILEGVSRKVKNMRNSRHTSDIAMAHAEFDDDRGMDAQVRRAAVLAQGEGGEPVDFQTASTIARMDPDKINYELVERLVEHIDRTNSSCDGAVLIFMPGMAEINMCCDELRANSYLARKCVIFNLHSSLGNADQKAVFSRPPRGKRKVVVGTNIMETSITIDDAVYVIDSGKFKENRYDPRRSLSQLVTCWVSKAAARQRTGRAGRVRPGQCYRLYTTGGYERLDDHQVCEMQRVPLESLILQIHVLNLGDEMDFLRKAMDPPVERAVQGSVSVLTGLGALSREEKQLTSLGFHLANLPLDVRIGKMIIIGAVLRCLDPVMTIAACVSVRSPFQASSNDAPEVDQVRKNFSRDYNSDLLAMYFAYSGYQQALERGGPAEGRAYCRDSYLSLSALAQIQATKQQYERYLVESGFVEVDRTKEGIVTTASKDHAGTGKIRFMSQLYVTLEGIVYEAGGRHYNVNSAVFKCVVAALVAGLYPNVAKLEPRAKPQPGAPPGRVPFVKAKSRDGSDVAIHPSSVNAARFKEFAYPFVCYLEKVKTSAIFLRDTTMVSPYAMVLFGGPSIYLPEYEELVFDNWVSFTCGEEDAVLLMRLKEQLESALMRKINDPTVEWESTAGNVVRAMEKLLKDEGSKSLPVLVERRDRRARYVDPATQQPKQKRKDKKEVRAAARRRLVTCFNCNEKGHLARDCKNRPLGIGPTEPCFICGARSHYPTTCPVITKKPVTGEDEELPDQGEA